MMCQCCLGLRRKHDDAVDGGRGFPAVYQTDVQQHGHSMGWDITGMYCKCDGADSRGVPALRALVAAKEQVRPGYRDKK